MNLRSDRKLKNQIAFIHRHDILTICKLLPFTVPIKIICFIHWMQIWRTTRWSPRTSYMKARLVSLQWFVLKMLPQKTIALSSICSVLFRCAYELLCFWMRQLNGFVQDSSKWLFWLNFFSFKSAWIFACAFQLSSKTIPGIFLAGLQKLRHFWRKQKFTQKSHLLLSCTQPFN